MNAQNLPALPPAESKPQPKKRRKLGFRLFLVAVALVIGAGGVWGYHIGTEADKDTHARKIAISAAHAALTKLTSGAVNMESISYPDAWSEGKVDWTFTVGACHGVDGYVKMAKRPAPDGAKIHVFVAGKNAKTPAADLPLVSEDDFLQFKRTISGGDSGLAHCADSDDRLQYVNG